MLFFDVLALVMLAYSLFCLAGILVAYAIWGKEKVDEWYFTSQIACAMACALIMCVIGFSIMIVFTAVTITFN